MVEVCGGWGGTKELLRLAMLFSLGDAGVEAIKAFILGKPFDLSDSAFDHLLRLFGGSQYLMDKSAKEGLGRAFLGSVLAPPTGFIDRPQKDIQGVTQHYAPGGSEGISPLDVASLRNLPIVGEIAYWRAGGGIAKAAKMEREHALDDAKKAYRKGDITSAKAFLQRYNEKHRPEGESRLKLSTVRSSIKREEGR